MWRCRCVAWDALFHAWHRWTDPLRAQDARTALQLQKALARDLAAESDAQQEQAWLQGHARAKKRAEAASEAGREAAATSPRRSSSEGGELVGPGPGLAASEAVSATEQWIEDEAQTIVENWKSDMETLEVLRQREQSAWAEEQALLEELEARLLMERAELQGGEHRGEGGGVAAQGEAGGRALSEA